MFKKIFSAVMSAVMVLAISSCGKQTEEPKTAYNTHIYHEDRIELSDDLTNIEKIMCRDEKIYIIGTIAENDSSTKKNVLQIIDFDGKLEKEVVLYETSGDFQGKFVAAACIDTDGGTAFILSSFSDLLDFTFVRYSPEGEKLAEVKLGEKFSSLNMALSIVSGLMALEDGRYLASVGAGVALISPDGTVEATFKDNSSVPVYTKGLYRTADGRIFTSFSASAWDDQSKMWQSKLELAEVDLEAMKLGSRSTVATSGEFVNGTDKYDLLISRDSGLMGYDIETGETEIIIDWLKSGYDITAVTADTLSVLADGRILCQNVDYQYKGFDSYDYDDSDAYISVLTEISPDELPEKKTVKLFALSLSGDARRHILEFNRNNLEYVIELTDYSDFDNSKDKMNMDMIAGNIPDIVILEADMLIDSYTSKGLFADLYEFIDNDPDMQRSDFLENYFRAYETNGKLYELNPRFRVSSLVGKASVVGNDLGWTVEEFKKITEKYPDAVIFGGLNKEQLLCEFLSNCGYSYIDKGNGKCFFNSEEFINILKICNEASASTVGSGTDLRSDRQLLSTVRMGSFLDICFVKTNWFGEPVTFIGYPSSKGIGSCFNNDFFETSFAISAKTEVPEGAWEFLKYFLSDEYQDMYAEQQTQFFPIKLTSIEKKAKSDQTPLSYVDGDGVTQYIKNEAGYPTDEDVEQVMDFISSIDMMSNCDWNIVNIVCEEAGAYFAGQKSAEQVAEIIQNRAQNYFDENR